MEETHNTIDADILDAAADWLLQIEEAPATLVSEAFERWLHADVRHIRAFNQLANDWGLAGQLAIPEARSAQSERRWNGGQSVLGRLRAPWAIGGIGALAAAAIMIVVLVQTPTPPTSEPSLYSTGTGEISQFDLADGSTLFLDARSSVEVRLTETERAVALKTGRLFVDVDSDAERPFRVTSDSVSFTALGTAYAVERTDQGWRLEVHEGVVRIETSEASSDITAGFGAILSPPGLTQFELASTLEAGLPDWTSERIVFEAMALSEAVEAFERYSDKPITVRGAGLRNFEISGAFRLTDADSFVRSVEVLTGASADESFDAITIAPED